MKTPSGRVHIGSVRAFLTHAFIYRALLDKKQEVVFSYVLEDHDPFDKIPSYIDVEKYAEHLGKPLYRVPSPERGFKSYGDRWAQEYIDIFKYLGVEVEIIWGSELYLSGKMNELIKICLDKAEKVRDIYRELYDQIKPEDWLPINMVCEKCGKLSTTRAYKWDDGFVYYKCEFNQVGWTEGCGFEGKAEPINGRAKLPWKVEWPCKWKVVGVTVEGAGKDHMSDGGSHDFAKLMCENVIDYEVPFAFSHEFFLARGRKMSSSKGVGSSALEISKILPAYLMKFAIARVRYSQAINFDPAGMTIPDLFDAFDEAAEMFWNRSGDDRSRTFELSQADNSYKNKLFLPRFRDVAKYMQDPKVDMVSKFEKEKNDKLTREEKLVLDEREMYAKIWLADYAPDSLVFKISENLPVELKQLSDEQLSYLRRVNELLHGNVSDSDELQQQLYDLSREVDLPVRLAFQAIYLILLGKTHGPKAAWLILQHLEKAKERLDEVLNN